MFMHKILIIDDEVSIGLILSRFLSKNGFEVHNSTSGNHAQELLAKESFNLVLCDYRLEDTDGRELLKFIKRNYPNTGVIIITGYSDIKLAIELIKMGAFDYITKPLYPDEILNTINKAIEAQRIINESDVKQLNEYPKEDRSQEALMPEEFVVGKSSASKELLKQIKLVAPTNFSVIITGESGTGKESIAKSIHFNSRRKNMPFIAMDCGSLTKDLAGSEFFGHEKGSFTGAISTKIGHFEMANGGTLFLDEIGNLSYETQALLLRTVQERKVKRIGSTNEIDLDVRIIVATNENLNEAIQNGRFREDLFYRFNEFNMHVPPLRERDKDIIIFAEYFLEQTCKELNKKLPALSIDVIEALLNYNWPGNVRELKNVVRRMALLSEGNTVQLKSLPLEISTFTKGDEYKVKEEIEQKLSKSTYDLKSAALEAEYETIINVLKDVNFNKSKAAQILKINRKTLYNKLNLINMDKS